MIIVIYFSCETWIPLVFWTLPNRRVRLALPLKYSWTTGWASHTKICRLFRACTSPCKPNLNTFLTRSCLIYKNSLFFVHFFFLFLENFFYWDTSYLEEFRAALLLLAKANTLNTFYKLSLAVFPSYLKLKLEISFYSRSPLGFFNENAAHPQ